MASIRFYIAAFHERLPISFGVGLAVAVLSLCAAVLVMAKKIPLLLDDVRQRKLPIAGGGLFNSEVYIGFHMFCFIAMYVMVFCIAAAVTTILSVASLRLYLWHKLLTIIVGSIGAIILQKGLVILAKKLVTDGGYGVTRVELYNILHFVQLVMSVFTGLAKSITRWVTGIVLYTFMFARLDISIFPSSFTANDLAYVGFQSVVIAEARLSNPTMLTMVALLTLEHRLRLLADVALVSDGASEEERLIDVDAFGQGDFQTAAAILNLWRVILRRRASVSNPLEPAVAPDVGTLDLAEFATKNKRQTLERVRNRWWLMFLLHKNPTLRRHRKHYLIIQHQDQDEAPVIETKEV